MSKMIGSKIWPIGIIAFFILLSLYYFFVMKTALTGRPAPVAESSYQESLNYQSTIDSLNLGRRYDIKAVFKETPSASQKERSFLLTIESSEILSNKANLKVKRFDTALFDQTIPLSKKQSESSYTFSLPNRKGLWSIEISTVVNQEKATIKERLFVE